MRTLLLTASETDWRAAKLRAARPNDPWETTTTGAGVFVRYVSSGRSALAPRFFGMPSVNSAYPPVEGAFTVISGEGLTELDFCGLGFRPGKVRALPGMPEEAKDPGEAPGRQQAWATGMESMGYQMDDRGRLFYAGLSRLFAWDGKGWKTRWRYPEPSVDRAGFLDKSSAGAVIVLPGDRIANVMGETDFLEIFELEEGPGHRARKIHGIPYDALGRGSARLLDFSHPQFCVFQNQLYFHMRFTGHVFRLDLSDFKLTDYETPWARLKLESNNTRPEWEGGAAAQPVIPDFTYFLPTPQGKLQVWAHMFNSPFPRVDYFELSGEGRSIKARTLGENEIPQGLMYLDGSGNRVALVGDGRRPPSETWPGNSAL